MTRPTFADPKTGFTFKRIFSSEERKDVLVAFLNDMLELDEAHRIVTVEQIPPEKRPVVIETKRSILNVKCTDARGGTYVVEMQVLQVEGFEKHVVRKVANAYVNQITRRELYPALNDVVGITICDFEIWPDDDHRTIPMLSRWRMTEQHTGSKKLAQIHLVFLELPKYDTQKSPLTAVEKWAYFFRNADNLTVVPDVLAEHPFVAALDATRIAAFTAAEWDAYILAGIAIQNDRGALAVAEQRGEARGELRGLRQSVEAICQALGIELTEERMRHLADLNAAGLTALLARLTEQKTWS